MTTRVYAVYVIPKSPEYNLAGLFKTKELAKEYIVSQTQAMKHPEYGCADIEGRLKVVFDIQLEEVQE